MVFHGPPRADARGEKSTLIFGVARTEVINGQVTPFARGYAAADCATLDLERFDEAVTGELFDFEAPGVKKVTLTLRGLQRPDGGTCM